ncbi:hypothetical protein ACO2Q0_18345 [Phenylobacterium sp. VNQ135]
MAAALALSACDHPAWVTGPRPEPPAWAAALIGRPLDSAFTRAPAEACLGNVDEVDTRYPGERPGARLRGWGWDRTAKAAIARVLVVGPDGKIAGAGETGSSRPDVRTALPEVTSETTGWWALALRADGDVQVWGVLGDGARVCALGGMKL